ncbi:MAG TPA: hypothetical protein VMF89_30405, partial [Polyangiales bacterium]|nr:hypothetical protein [Polyangiales bacterium]
MRTSHDLARARDRALRRSWLSALLLLGVPVLLGNKGCEADLHEGDAEAVHEEGHEQDAGTRDDDDRDDAPPPGAPNPPPGDPKGEPTPALDAGAPAPAKDAGSVTPTKDAGAGGTVGRCGTRGGV